MAFRLAPSDEDVVTTPRRPLTPMQRLKLFEDHKGICALCGLKIHAARGEKWRDEHMRALGLGGSNDPDNRAPVHLDCALAKDKDDLPRIAKAKQQKAKGLGIKSRKGPPMPGSRDSIWRKPMRGPAVRRT